MLGYKLNHVSKKGPRCSFVLFLLYWSKSDGSVGIGVVGTVVVVGVVGPGVVVVVGGSGIVTLSTAENSRWVVAVRSLPFTAGTWRKVASSLRQNDVVTSFWRNNDVIIRHMSAGMRRWSHCCRNQYTTLIEGQKYIQNTFNIGSSNGLSPVPSH